MFELRHGAQYLDPLKVSMNTTFERWNMQMLMKLVCILDEYDEIKADLRDKDKVTQLLGMYSPARIYTHQEFAVDSETAWKNASCAIFVKAMQKFNKATENTTLKKYHFRLLFQKDEEKFMSFFNHVSKQAKHCQFDCESGSFMYVFS